MIQHPDSFLGIPTPKGVAHLVDVIVDGSAVVVFQVKGVE